MLAAPRLNGSHWPVPVGQLRRVVPAPLSVDTFDGQAWLGVVAFRLTDVHLRGLPNAPGAAHFPEVNLRTYVTLDGQPGVLFLNLLDGLPAPSAT